MNYKSEYKFAVANASYLGSKGYTIPKSVLTADDLEFLKKDLFLKPQIAGPSFGPVVNDAFPVYRENDKKIYIPRFYGIDRYGEPAKSELAAGDDICVPFTKELRDYQDKIVGIYCADPKPKGGIFEIYCGAGKTVMALKIVSLLKKKTLILVHKEFLMNQWIERIAEFLPSARVGKIQANVCDCAGKDIVIGMIQTMYNKVFPPEIYSQFGLTIVDEVHRIGSEEFSKTLLKTITPYMLGISATVERKDKLTRLLYMFIGPKLHSMLRKQDDVVLVRGLEFITNDAEFNEVECDFRGQPKYSTMISKLCGFGPRTRFIIKVVNDLIAENPDSQIMVLAHNRCLLTDLAKSFDTNAGFYVGGMKQKDLEATESKQIVLATYAMAAEALDIKSLTTLVMATPKTDITQSVGRILRMKHEKPIVVDIVDAHQPFQNQWKMRKRFYRKSNYQIDTANSKTYTRMSDTPWFCVYNPKVCVKEEDEEQDEDGDIGQKKCLIDVSEMI